MRYEDSCQAWVTAASGCLILFMTYGINRVSGLLFVALMEKEGLSRGAASWPFSLPGAAAILIFPVAGVLSTRCSPAWLTVVGTAVLVIGYIPCYLSTNIFVVSIFFGAIRGCGFGVIALIVPIVTGTSFKRHRATAMGLSTSGEPIGGIILPSLTQFFLNQYGVNGTFLLLGAISAHTFLSALGYKWYHQKPAKTEADVVNTDEASPLLVETDEPARYSSVSYTETTERSSVRGNERDFKVSTQEAIGRGFPASQVTKESSSSHGKSQGRGEKPTTTWHILRCLLVKWSFYLVCFTSVFNVLVVLTWTQVVVDYVADKGIADSMALYLITSTSVGEIVGRLCLGWIPDRKILRIENHVAMCLLVTCGVMVLMINSDNFTVLVIATFLLGVGQGSMLSMTFVLFADRMTKKEMAIAVAMMRCIIGISILIRPPIIGFFRDSLGSYDGLFYVFSGIFLFLASVWMVDGCITSRQIKKNDTL